MKRLRYVGDSTPLETSMTLASPDDKPAFDADAQARVRQLCTEDRIPEAVAVLAAHEPHERSEQIDFEFIHGHIQMLLGNYRGAYTRFVRALRFTSRHAQRRAYVRTKLAFLLYRIGETATADRQFRRGLAEIYTEGRERGQIPWLLAGLAVLQMNLGNLTQSIRMYEESLALLGNEPSDEVARSTGSMNIALALMEKGELARAGEMFEQLVQQKPPDLATWRPSHLYVGRALHAIYMRDFARAEASLVTAAELSGETNARSQILVRQYRGELRLARGEAIAALPELETLLADILEKTQSGDHVPMAARLLATSLFAAGRYEEALEKGLMAARVAAQGDVLERCAGMRIAGQSLAALGGIEEARTTFAELRSRLQTTEFMLERQRLESAIAASGVELSPLAKQATPTPPPRLAPIALALRDGRRLLCADEALASRITLAAAASRLPVLIEGETGTGKELAAHLIHERSDRASRPLVVVDCATLPEGLAEAELFGAARGAYTGAVNDRAGLIASAEGGTLFLDELPELPLALQAKLLRVLQDGSYRRVGEDRVRHANVRVLAATNRDIEDLVQAGELKSDLFFRLNGHRVQLPPLRERPDMIAPLAAAIAASEGLVGVSPEALERLEAYDWPGNVRELEMCLRVAAAATTRGARIEAASLGIPERGDDRAANPGSLKDRRHLAERDHLRRVLERHGGNVTAAAKALSISRQGFYKALRRAGLSPGASTEG
jgi:tetratricopeptide (TPR) repeat protein